MNIFDGILNFLTFVNNNWTMIAAIVALGLAAIKKFSDFMELSEEDRKEAAKKEIEEQFEKIKHQIIVSMLDRVTNAESYYGELLKAGEIKRSQVISDIYREYPILSQMADQDSVIKFLDEIIDAALVKMREILDKNSTTA